MVGSRLIPGSQIRTLNSSGTSLLTGILYVEGACVLSAPDPSHHSAINQAIASLAPGPVLPALDAPATPERVLMGIKDQKLVDELG